MISVTKADELIRKHTIERQSDYLNIERLRQEVLIEPLVADRNYPPFDRVAMDGIAFSLSAWKKGLRSFTIEDHQKAGEPQKSLKKESGCLEVMTGAVLPQGCDVVIRYEDTQIKNQTATIESTLNISKMQNIHREGVDYQKNDVLVSKKTLMSSPHWSIAASIGKTDLKISKRPKIAIISTGDELVDIAKTPKLHQIRLSNAYTLLSSLRLNGFNDVTLSHIKDDPKEIHTNLKTNIETHDITILSGGVSMGKFDFIPKSLSDLKVKEIFHKIKQRPGKPLWFGVTENKKMVFGLPGNPVSALICFHRYVLPALWSSLGITNDNSHQQPFAILEKEIVFKKPLTYFLPVKIRYDKKGQTLAEPIQSNGSGDFCSLIKSDGFLELNENQEQFQTGQAFPLYFWNK
jgi:molybdopterin molybdotransferase